MPAISRDGQRVVFDDLGPRAPDVILLAHNLLAHRGSFAATAALVSARARVLNVDLRGHGDSRGTKRAFSTLDLAADLDAVLDAAEARRAILVGASLGATAALTLARARPDRVRGLVLLAATPHPATLRDRVTFAALATVLRAVGPGPLLPTLLANLHGPGVSPELRAATAAQLRLMDRRDMARAVHAWAARPALTGTLCALRIPSHVLVGVAEPDRPDPASLVLAAELGATLHTFAGAGHTLQAERPVELAGIITYTIEQTCP